MVIAIILLIVFLVYLRAIAAINQIPKDSAEADLYITIPNRYIYGL